MEKNGGKAIKCACGKIIAVERGGKIYIKCRGCKHEFEIAPQPVKAK